MSNRKNIPPHLVRAVSQNVSSVVSIRTDSNAVSKAEKHDIVVVSLDYRLAPQAALPAILEDVKDGVEWCRNELPKLIGKDVFDPTRLIVGGASAGALIILCMLSRSADTFPTFQGVTCRYFLDSKSPELTLLHEPLSRSILSPIRSENSLSHLSILFRTTREWKFSRATWRSISIPSQLSSVGRKVLTAGRLRSSRGCICTLIWFVLISHSRLARIPRRYFARVGH